MATEKRLISLDEAIAKVKDDGILGEGYSEDERIDDVIDILESCRLVDAVEVVYCDECKNHGICIPEDTFRWMRIEKPFCCAGRRKTNTQIAKMDGDGNG